MTWVQTGGQFSEYLFSYAVLFVKQHNKKVKSVFSVPASMIYITGAKLHTTKTLSSCLLPLYL